MQNKHRPVSIHFHPQREVLFNELHARPFPVLSTPCRVSHLLLLPDPQQAMGEFQHLLQLCQRHAVLPPSPESSCYYQNFGAFELRWERHTEFSSYTLISKGVSDIPFSRSTLQLLPEGWLNDLPGQLFGITHVEVLPTPDGEPDPDQLAEYFEGYRLVGSQVQAGLAWMWSACRIHADGAGRLLIQDRGLDSWQSGRLVRTLLELETYRMMLLLAFPPAKAIAPQIRGMDQQLATAIQKINQIRNLDDERQLLVELGSLAARIEQLIADNNFRFSAARAYHELIMDRLIELSEEECPRVQTLGEFFQRRLTPAWRTCKAADHGLDELSRRIERASELLRTRIDLTIETQNQRLLQGMDRRIHTQLRLQQTVEGLSVVAISYYLVGLSKYLAESAKALGLIGSSSLAVGAAVPVLVTLVWFVMRRLKRKLLVPE